jgi:hypothetical protein
VAYQLGSAQPVMGTAMLGSTFGKIKKLDIERVTDSDSLPE